MLARRLAILDSLPPDLQTAEGSGLKKVGTSWKAKARRRQREGVLANLGNHGAWGPARPAGYLPPHPDFDGLVAAAGNGRDRGSCERRPKTPGWPPGTTYLKRRTDHNAGPRVF